MKKIIALILSIFILCSYNVHAYTNIEKIAADFLSYKGIIKSQDDVLKYNLGKNISRKEMAKVTLNLSGKNVSGSCSEIFKDLKSGDWGCKYAESGVKYGFFTKNYTFKPQNNISKIEALKMVMKGANIERENIDDWKKGYVNSAVKVGLLEDKFTDYSTSATRGWIFLIAKNAIEYSENDDDIKLIIELLNL